MTKWRRHVDTLITEINADLPASVVIDRLISWASARRAELFYELGECNADIDITKKAIGDIYPGLSEDRIDAWIAEKFKCRKCIAGIHREDWDSLIELLHVGLENLKKK